MSVCVCVNDLRTGVTFHVRRKMSEWLLCALERVKVYKKLKRSVWVL